MAWQSPRTWASGEFWTAALVNEQLRDNLIALTPVVGEYKMFTRQPTAVETVIGVNWLECNGTAVSRSTYPTLYSLFNGMRVARGSGTTTLTAAMDGTQTTLAVANYNDLWPGGRQNWYTAAWPYLVAPQDWFTIQIDSEKMLVTGRGTYPYLTLTVARAREGTLAASHNSGATVSLAADLPFGSGDGATTFCVPDLHGRSPWSAARSGGHVDMTTVGKNDRAALNARRPKHRHETLTAGAGSGGSQVPFAWGTLGSGQPTWTMGGGVSGYNLYGQYVGPLDEPGFFGNFAGTTTPVDAPGYLVTGVWGIRFIGV